MVGLVLVGACGRVGYSLSADDLAPALVTVDAAAPDLATPDASMDLAPYIDQSVIVDLAPSDRAMPDTTPLIDAARPDLAHPDFALPDLSLPDLSLPDLSLPDLSLPDLSVPDFSLPDLSLPDLTPPQDLSFQPISQVLVVGGSDNNGNTPSTSEVFNSSAAMFFATGNVSYTPGGASGLCAPAMTLLGSGKVLIAGGGCGDQSITTNLASVFDPSTMSWSPSASSMAFGRDQFVMVTLADGTALVTGGCAGGCSGPNVLGQFFGSVGPSTESYINGTFGTMPSLNTPRGGLSNGGVTLASGQVLVCGGNNAFNTTYSTCELFTPGDKWRTVGSLPDPGARQMVLLQNGTVLALTQDGQSSIVFSGALWQPAVALPGGAIQLGARLVVLANGDVLAIGGSSAIGPVSTVSRYSASSKSWTGTTPLGTARAGAISVLLKNGLVLVAGGQSSTTASSVLSTSELYDPLGQVWAAGPTMSQARAGANAVLLP